MQYELRPRQRKKDFMPLLFYALPRDVLLLVAGHAAVRPQHGYFLRHRRRRM